MLHDNLSDANRDEWSLDEFDVKNTDRVRDWIRSSLNDKHSHHISSKMKATKQKRTEML